MAPGPGGKDHGRSNLRILRIYFKQNLFGTVGRHEMILGGSLYSLVPRNRRQSMPSRGILLRSPSVSQGAQGEGRNVAMSLSGVFLGKGW